jgi:nitrite reductase (NADH) large subunit
MRRRLVIIGNGMAATRLAQALVARDARGFRSPSSAMSLAGL